MAAALRTLIARNDESFSFIYQENIDRLENVSFFDPETDVPCLDDVALLYLPGGYPEKHLEALVTAEATRRAIKPYTITARKQDRKLSLGYRRFMLDGKEYRGHEFHYTQFMGESPRSVTQVYNAKGEPVPTPVIRYKNVLASYTHIYQVWNMFQT